MGRKVSINGVVAPANAICLLASALWTSSAVAGAWLQEQGHGQIIVTGLFSSADEIFDDHRDLRPIDFQKVTGALFAEYGLSESLTVVGDGEVGFESGSDGFGTSVTNFGLGARVRLYQSGGFVLSGQAMARIDRDQRETVQPVSLDVAHPLLEARALAGYGFTLGNKPAFVDIQGAYRLQLSDAPDEARVDVTLGLRPMERLLLMVQTASTFSVSSSGDRPPYHYHKLGGSAVYDLSNSLSLQVGGFATIAGRNALRERGAISALWYRF